MKKQKVRQVSTIAVLVLATGVLAPRLSASANGQPNDPLGPLAVFVGGTWVAEIKGADGEPLTVECTYEWASNKKAIRYAIVFKNKGKSTPQYDGTFWWHPEKKQVAMIQVDSGGNMTESLFKADGNKLTGVNTYIAMDGAKQEQRVEIVIEGKDAFGFKAFLPKGTEWVEAVAIKYRRVQTEK